MYHVSEAALLTCVAGAALTSFHGLAKGLKKMFSNTDA